MILISSVRFATLAALDENRGSSANAGCSRMRVARVLNYRGKFLHASFDMNRVHLPGVHFLSRTSGSHLYKEMLGMGQSTGEQFHVGRLRVLRLDSSTRHWRDQRAVEFSLSEIRQRRGDYLGIKQAAVYPDALASALSGDEGSHDGPMSIQPCRNVRRCDTNLARRSVWLPSSIWILRAAAQDRKEAGRLTCA